MLKKLASSLFAIVLCASLFVLPSTAFAQSGKYVFDERNLFDSTQFAELESKAESLADTYGMGVYFLTCRTMGGKSDPSSSERTSFATGYYREHQLGLNKADGSSIGDGIMFVVAADSRDYVTIAYGQGSYAFSDKGIAKMEDAVTSELGDNDWYGAAKEYYDQVGKQLEYYKQHGKAQQPLSLIDWVIRLGIVFGIPLIITYTLVNGWRKEMLTAVERDEAGNYLDSSSLNVTVKDDQFIRTSVVATPKPKSSSGGGGGWGGGGGGGFSSSGGGKF